MTLLEYLDKIRRNHALTAGEIKILGLNGPLKHGWVRHHGGMVLSDDQVAAMIKYRHERIARRAERRAANGKKGKRPRDRGVGRVVVQKKPDLTKSYVDPSSNEFLSTYEWRVVRMMALEKYGAVCQCCGASPKSGAVINVDHIKPRRLFPELALDVNNLQVLCHECNHGKGNWSQTDWRDSGNVDIALLVLDKLNNKK